MTNDELLALVTEHLDRGDPSMPWSTQRGAVLYSNLASIRPGRFYLIGINPAGQTQDGVPIRQALDAPKGSNSFADECWSPACSSVPCEHIDPTTGFVRSDARSTMQQRVCHLMSLLRTPPRDIPTSNLIFARAPQLQQLPNNFEWFQRCWPVHQALLRLVRPDWIIMLGYGPAYNFLDPRNTGGWIKPGSRAAWHTRLTLDLDDGSEFEAGILAVAHPGHLGFNGARLGAARHYPVELKDFIDKQVFKEEPEAPL